MIADTYRMRTAMSELIYSYKDNKTFFNIYNIGIYNLVKFNIRANNLLSWLG